MKVKRIKKGELETLPCLALDGGKSSGWVSSKAPRDGLLVIINSKEQNEKGIFLEDEDLNKLGYFVSENNSKKKKFLNDNFTKKQLFSVLNILDKGQPINSKKNKEELSASIIEKLLGA